MIDTSAGTAGATLQRLMAELAARRARYDVLQMYYDGENGIPAYADAAVRDAARRLMQMSRTNYAELAIEATRERMDPLGFRTGAQNDDLGDSVAWDIWQANGLDADHKLVDSTALSLSQAYMIVGSIDEETGVPLITPEDPREVICEVDPARRRRATAAAKVFHDVLNDLDVAYLYVPGYVVRAQRKHQEGELNELSGWDWSGPPQPLGVPVVPVVPFAYRPQIRGLPKGEIEPHLPILDRINYTILNRLEIMTLQAFRQRAVKGVPTTNPDGTEVDYDELFRQGPGAIWTLPASAEMWESGALDLTPVLESVKADVRDFAAVTRTPLSYLFPDAAQGSAEGASLTREGLIFKVKDRMGQAGEAYEAVMSIAFMMMGDAERAARSDLEVIWASPERYTLSERGQAATQAIGLSKRTVQEKIWQLTPQEIARNEAELAAEALLEPDPTPVTTPEPVGAAA